MIPLKDDNPTYSTPYVTYTLIAINIVVFFFQMMMPAQQGQAFIMTYGAIPTEIIQGHNLYAIFTSMFLHGSLMHLLGNMLYLYIFGDNIEHICGHFRFLGFYLLAGLMAFVTHFILNVHVNVPMVGASGAISGILGAYALRFPQARVHVLVFLFFLITTFRVPAVVVLGLWFVMQLFNGMAALSAQAGVAWFAHVGGFVAGLLFLRFFEKDHYRVSFRR